ncbi:replication-relaxation family protein [Catenulispora acidiphila]|uniref:replication-relaxation family protein n=1 Tax=Catenulispora acidiphila TaxID=304895 RepID=UPI00167FDF44|nr:replication-relaxation family protein [Catenulispora acidiphila]
MLASLNEFRLLSGSQLRRLHCPGGEISTQARKTRAIMRRLTELGVVARAERGVGGIRSGSEGYVFGLSGLGHAVLDRDQPGARRHRSAIESKSTFTAHILACSELMCQLVEHSRAGGCTIEELRAEPGCWRWFSSQSGGRRPLKPDAYVRLTVDDFDLAAFIEIDLATESLPTIASKCAVYLDYWRSGAEQRVAGFFPRVWWLVPHPDRAGAISRTIQRLAPAEQRLFAVALIEDAVAALTTTPHTDTKGGAQ